MFYCPIAASPPRRLAASPPRRGRLAASPWLPRRPSIAIFQKKLTKKFCPFLAASPPRRGRLAASLPRRGRLAASPWVLLLTLLIADIMADCRRVWRNFHFLFQIGVRAEPNFTFFKHVRGTYIYSPA